MIELQKYEPGNIKEWDATVRASRNGTFLHERSYMDYHSDRFSDHSLLVFRNGKIVGTFPANAIEDLIQTHGGLTYGGLLATESLGAAETLLTFELIADYYKNLGFKRILYKPVPYVFHTYPCQEELYALFRVGARLTRRDASSVLALGNPVPFSKGRKWSINKAKKGKICIQRSEDFAGFYELLSSTLLKFGAAPTHTLDELVYLQSRFPENIFLYVAESNFELLAGAVVYDFGNSVHTQYLATSKSGRDVGALDYLLAELIEKIYCQRQYFSFGISTEDQGKYLNTGLIAQKEGFGARTVVHDFYEWKL